MCSTKTEEAFSIDNLTNKVKNNLAHRNLILISCLPIVFRKKAFMIEMVGLLD
jgi:hypothetical protein